MENNKREGKGIMIYQNGDIYEGHWKNNEKEGKGIMKYKNGEIIYEYWKNGEKLKDESEYNKNIILSALIIRKGLQEFFDYTKNFCIYIRQKKIFRI